MMSVRPFLLLAALLLTPVAQAQLTSAFTYQGTLDDRGGPANGSYDFQFSVFDALTQGNQIGTTLIQLDLDVTDGAFSTLLDFGAGIWQLPDVWPELYLEVLVRGDGDASYTTLAPRTLIRSTPYAVMASSVTVPLSLAGQVDDPVSGVVEITNTGTGDGLVIEGAGDHGIAVLASGDDGLFISSVGDDGVAMFSPAGNGVDINSPGETGVTVTSSTFEAFRAEAPIGNGLSVISGGNHGVYINVVDLDGVQVGSAGGDGVSIASADEYGIRADGDLAGAFLRNDFSASTLTPDLILGGTSSTAAGDNAVLTSDPAYGSSDLAFVSNDAAIIYLDEDQDETGEFQIRGDGDATVFQVLDTGSAAVTGTLSGGAGASRIDHPLDPANQTLQHAFVESPEMTSVYHGTAVLDAQGQVTVALPSYAEALGRDFRYQLTPVGAPMPNLHIAEEVMGNRFAVSGGVPSGRVSWQVTAIRQDAWAERNRLAVEIEKTGDARGRYLHPAAFGEPMSRAVGALDTDGPSLSVDQAVLDEREAEDREAENHRRRQTERANRPAQDDGD